MISTQQLILIFRQTLHPQTTHQATQFLESVKSTKGFSTNLVLISDQEALQLPIKISALVYLKNLIEQQSKNPTKNMIEPSDFSILKDSIISLLIKFIQKNEVKLLPTLKYIFFLLVKYSFKEGHWESLPVELIKNLELCESEQSIKGTLLMIKILFQILGKSLTEQIRLNNVAHKIMLPLTNVALKMFANLSVFTCCQLQQIFKILTQAIEFHLPEIIQKNIHIFMVLVKNVLDLKCDGVSKDLDGEGRIRTLRLKREALSFLQKMYERHSTSNLSSLKEFVCQFNKRYTKAYFETIVGIMMEKLVVDKSADNPGQQQNQILSVNFGIGTRALSIFSFIATNKCASQYIEDDLIRYQIKILHLSMQKFLSCHSHQLENKIKASSQSPGGKNSQYERVFQNYTDFVQSFREERLSLRLFVSTIFGNKNVPNIQRNIEDILQLLLDCVIEGSFREKELALYLLGSLQKEIELVGEQILNQKMIIVLTQYVSPLLLLDTKSLPKQDQFFATLVKLRAYQMYARYEYLQTGLQHQIHLCENIFHQITTPTLTQIDLFLKIQAIETFNLTLANQHLLIPKLSSNITTILTVYTELLSQDFQVMKFYDEIITLFSPYIEPIVYELLELLTDMFFKLNDQKMAKSNCLTQELTFKHARNVQILQQDEFVFNQDEIRQESEDNQTIYEDMLHNYDSIGTQCLVSIKKLLFKHPLNQTNYHNSPQLQQKLMLLILKELSSQDETFIKETFSILNLLLYKNFISENFHLLLPFLLYPIFISHNPAFAQQIQNNMNSSSLNQLNGYENKTQNSFASLYMSLMQSICQDVYERPFSLLDQIGCLKNFIKVFGKRLYTLICPISNKSYLEMLIQAVACVQEGGENQNYSQSQVLSVLSLYQVLLENKIFQSFHYEITSSNQMQQHSDPYFGFLMRNIMKWSVLIENGSLETEMRQRFKSFYLRVIMVATITYPNEFLRFFEFQVLGLSINQFFLQYPTQKVFGQLDNLVLSKINQYLKPLKQIKQQSTHTLHDAYIFIKGIVSLSQVMVTKFIIGNSNETNTIQIHQRMQSMSHREKGFFSKLYLLIVKLSVHVSILAIKQFSDASNQNLSTAQLDQFQLDIDEMFKKENGLGQTGTNFLDQENDLFIKMLSNLNIKASQNQQQIDNENHEISLNEKSNQFQTEYQKHLKISKSVMSEPLFGSDQSEEESLESSEFENPFNSYDEEYMCAYDSPMFGGFSGENKKKMLERIIQDLAQIHMNKKVFYLQQFCRQKFNI